MIDTVFVIVTAVGLSREQFREYYLCNFKIGQAVSMWMIWNYKHNCSVNCMMQGPSTKSYL